MEATTTRTARLAHMYKTGLAMTEAEAQAAAERTVREQANTAARANAITAALRTVVDAAGDAIRLTGVEHVAGRGYVVRVTTATEIDPLFNMRVRTPAAKRAMESLRLVAEDFMEIAETKK